MSFIGACAVAFRRLIRLALQNLCLGVSSIHGFLDT